MSWYTVTKTIKGIPYIYRQRSKREGKSVRSESVFIGRGDGGGRAGNLTITTANTRDIEKVPIKVNTTRFGFHGARNGFNGSPIASDDGQLGEGFYVTTEKQAELYRVHSPKVATFYSDDENIEPEFEGDLVEFDIKLLKTKTVDNYQGLIELGQKSLGHKHDWITPTQIEKMKEKLAKEGYHALKIRGGGKEKELPQMVVFPDAIHRLRKVGAELTLHLRDRKKLPNSG